MEEYLHLIPERNEKVRLDEENYRLLVPMDSPLDVLARRLQGNYRRIELDEVGTYIWKLCNGSRTVEDIGKALRARFGDEVEPLYERLVVFLLELHRRHLIRFKRSGGEMDEGDAHE